MKPEGQVRIPSGCAIAAGDIFKNAKTPAIGTSCTNPQVTLGNDYYFRISYIDPFQGAVMANYAYNKQNSRNVAIVIESGDDYSAGFGNYFEQGYAKHHDLRPVLADFRRDFHSVAHDVHSEKHLSSIEKGAACKRLCMYLRWMVRRDDRGVDFGLWDKIPMSALYMPLDVHTGRMGRSLGLLSRKQSDWKAVEELTASLREFSEDDPVRYDYALFGVGISGMFD